MVMVILGGVATRLGRPARRGGAAAAAGGARRVHRALRSSGPAGCCSRSCCSRARGSSGCWRARARRGCMSAARRRRRCSTCAASRSASAASSPPTASTSTSTRGEVHALIGPNGAGKTTLVAQLAGQLASDRGTDRLRRRRHHARWPPHQRARRGLARSFQITRLFRSASVLDNVALAVQAVSGTSLRAWRPVRATRALFERARQVLDDDRPRRARRRMRSARSRTASGARSRSAWRWRAGRA